ncbi:MAG: hypothetical protein FJ335_13215, partial [Sphingomonadales bacterium]|nr:hypothetical protein [Sphingomonadales bacterium]
MRSLLFRSTLLVTIASPVLAQQAPPTTIQPVQLPPSQVTPAQPATGLTPAIPRLSDEQARQLVAIIEAGRIEHGLRHDAAAAKVTASD